MCSSLAGKLVAAARVPKAARKASSAKEETAALTVGSLVDPVSKRPAVARWAVAVAVAAAAVAVAAMAGFEQGFALGME